MNQQEREAKLWEQWDDMRISQASIDNHETNKVESAIKSPALYIEDLKDALDPNKKIKLPTLPWEKTKDVFQFRPSEVSLWTGYNGHKKSMVLGQVMLDLAAQGQTSVIASFEMHPTHTLERMLFQAIGNPEPAPEWIERFGYWLHEKMYLYDKQDSVTTDEVLRFVRYCAEDMQLNHIVIDSLMKCGLPKKDGYEKERNFIDQLCAIAKSTGAHIHLVAHMRKPQKGGDTSRIPDRYDISGGSDISNQAHNIFIAWCNDKKKNELEKPTQDQDQKIINSPDFVLAIEKQRNGKYEGKKGFWFDERSLQHKDSPNHLPTNYERYMQ